MAWGAWVALIGGIVAVVGEFVPGAYLALIGGVVAVVGAIGAMSSK